VSCPLPLRTALQQEAQRTPDTEMLNMVSVPMRCVNVERRASAATGVEPALRHFLLWLLTSARLLQVVPVTQWRSQLTGSTCCRRRLKTRQQLSRQQHIWLTNWRFHTSLSTLMLQRRQLAAHTLMHRHHLAVWLRGSCRRQQHCLAVAVDLRSTRPLSM
jgi:hypothetical protein